MCDVIHWLCDVMQWGAYDVNISASSDLGLQPHVYKLVIAASYNLMGFNIRLL